jgi:hypothetical protein
MRKTLAIGLVALFCVAVASTVSVRFDHKVAEQEQNFRSTHIKAVVATRDIGIGATIRLDDVFEEEILKELIPAGVGYYEELSGNRNRSQPTTFYIRSSANAVGRISKGIRRKQILYFSYPGMRGDTVVFAKNNIPKNTRIVLDSLVEKEANPCDIPYNAIESKSQVVGKLTDDGLFKDEILVEDRRDRIRSARCEAVPGQKYVAARKDIAAGVVVSSSDVEHGIGPPNRPSDPKFATKPEGRRLKHRVVIGQIILEDDLQTLR